MQVPEAVADFSKCRCPLRIRCLRARICQLLPELIRVSHLVLKDLSNLMRQVNLGKAGDELIDGAILRSRSVNGLVQTSAQRGPKRGCAFVRKLAFHQRVRDGSYQRHIERNRTDCGKDRHRCEGPGCVPNAELVEHVRVGKCQIGDNEIREQQPPEHRNMNNAPGAFLVAAHRFEMGCLDCRLDADLVNLVEIDGNTAGQVRLLAERHVHETDRLVRHRPPPYFDRSIGQHAAGGGNPGTVSPPSTPVRFRS